MLVYEFKLKGKEAQFSLIDEAIRTCQFIRNKALRYWLDNKESKPNETDLCALVSEKGALCQEFDFVKKLNSMARQAGVQRAWVSIQRFFKKLGKFPKFKKNNHSVEYKTSGWKLSGNKRKITFSDGFKLGSFKLIGSYDLNFYEIKEIKRITLIKRADGYYVQFAINRERNEAKELTGKEIGIDVGLESFLTDSDGKKYENPRYLRKSEKRLKWLQRSLSNTEKGSSNRKKAIKKVGKVHLKIQRQRKDYAVKLARQLCLSNDKVFLEDLKVQNMLKNHKLAKSISDVGWRLFRNWLEYFGKVFKTEIVVIDPKYTSQKCSNCGKIVKKSLSVRTHCCPDCGFITDRDHNAAINIVGQGMSEFKLVEKKPSVRLAKARKNKVLL